MLLKLQLQLIVQISNKYLTTWPTLSLCNKISSIY